METPTIMSAENKKKMTEAAIANSPIAVILGIFLLLQQLGIFSSAPSAEDIIKQEQRWAQMERSMHEINFKLEKLGTKLDDSSRDYVSREAFNEWLQILREKNPTVTVPTAPRQ
jgi:hypothetical protein